MIPESSFTYECTHTNPHTVIPQTVHSYLFLLFFSHFLIYCSTLHCSNHHTGPSEQKIFCFTCWQQCRVLMPLTLKTFALHAATKFYKSVTSSWCLPNHFGLSNWCQLKTTNSNCCGLHDLHFRYPWTTRHMHMWVSSDNLTL